MKKPVVDYRRLRPDNLTSPEFRHLLYLLGWVGYFCLYFLTENLIPADRCAPVWCPLDDIIPFNEFFVIFYCGWYGLIVFTLLYFALYNPENFKRVMTYIITTQILAMAVYILYPTRQDLRPAEFPRDNLLTRLMGLIYAFDTPTGVCPSLHVAYSVGIASTWLREKSASPLAKTLLTVFCLGVCVSVAFVKQHSVVDIFAAIPVCLVAEYITFFRKQKSTP